MNLPTLPAPADLRQGEPAPGEDLSPSQREACALSILEGLSHRQLAQRVGLASRTVDRWALTEAWRRYAAYLLSQAVTEARQAVTSHFARAAPQVAERVTELALGTGRKGKPQHPYMDRFCSMVLERVAPKPSDRQAAVALEVDDGDRTIRIIVAPGAAWSSRADWRAEEEGQAQQE